MKRMIIGNIRPVRFVKVRYSFLKFVNGSFASRLPLLTSDRLSKQLRFNSHQGDGVQGSYDDGASAFAADVGDKRDVEFA